MLYEGDSESIEICYFNDGVITNPFYINPEKLILLLHIPQILYIQLRK